jgi:lipoyl(octanoyl) transferase
MRRSAPLVEEAAIEWRVSARPVPYPFAVEEMERRVAAIAAALAPEMVWLLEHPPLYTAGTSARPEGLVEPARLPVFETGRGGQYTYHGPGQRVAYVLRDLRRHDMDVRSFVRALEGWAIAALARLGVKGERRKGRVGIWVDRSESGEPPGREDKIAAIGVRVRRGVAYHGMSLNVAPDLAHYRGIVPCGIPGPDVSGLGVTSLLDLGIDATLADVDAALRATFEDAFPRAGRRG